jgi:hypothetical protein
MSAADQYRRSASDCIAITAFFADPRQRAAILALAEAWSRLAQQAEKNAMWSARHWAKPNAAEIESEVE